MLFLFSRTEQSKEVHARWLRRQNFQASEYRRAAASILTKATGTDPRTFLITSAYRGEGRSTVALQLASQLSQKAGAGVLLIEADFETPAISDWCGFNPTPAGTKFENLVSLGTEFVLDVLPVGINASATIPLKDRGTWLKDLLNDLPKQYDVILVDAPPLIQNPESVALARTVTNLIMVVEAGRLNANDLQAVKTLVANERLRVVSIIMNKCHRSRPRWLSWILSIGRKN